jgi:exopolysaccharide biosynthesis predicted pyruvyltransferase EpsI
MNMRHTNQKALLVTTQRSQCWHLQRVTCNKCLMTNGDSALDLKIGPKEKDTDKKKQKNTLTREDKELS